MRLEAKAILRNTSVKVHPDEFAILSVELGQWSKLLEDQSLGPSGTAPFMIFSDPYEVTLLLNRSDFERIRHAVDESRVEKNFRLLTFTTELDFAVVGLWPRFRESLPKQIFRSAHSRRFRAITSLFARTICRGR